MIVKRPLYLLISMTLLTLLLIRLINLYLAEIPSYINVIPDDAFYYLQLAKNYNHLGIWTFDGQNITTGFHPLWANLMRIFTNNNLMEFKIIFFIIGLISSILITISLYITLYSAEALFNKVAAPIVAAPFFSYPIILQSTSLMESPLVIFICSITVFIILTKELNYKSLIFIFVLGLLGSLTRSDYLVFFVGISMSLMFYSLYVSDFYIRYKSITLKCMAALIGMIFGLVILIVNNYEITGKFSQGSAEVKYFWSHIVGHSAIPALKILFSIILPINIGTYIGIIVIIPLILLVFIFFIRKYTLIQLSFIHGCSLSIALYICVLSLNSQSIQSWYSANFVIPAGLIMTALGVLFLKLKKIFIIIIICYAIGGLHYSNIYIEKHQIGMLNGALYLRDEMPENKKYAAWNAGIIGFFSNKNVINLDGLVNDSAIYYIKKNQLWDYIIENNIDYIIDYGEMFTNSEPWKLQLRGGHDDNRFHRCVKPGKIIDGGASPWIKSPLRIYEINKSCH